MRKLDLENVTEATMGGKLPAGGYVCRITDATDVPAKEYLEITYDVAEGEYQDFYADKEWPGRFYRSYKEGTLSFFKAFKTAVEKSNPGYQFRFDEHTLRGKLVGLVLGEEEYEANDGTVKTRLYVVHATGADSIREGKYKVPELKRLQRQKAKSIASLPIADDDDDLPF